MNAENEARQHLCWWRVAGDSRVLFNIGDSCKYFLEETSTDIVLVNDRFF
jgi:hypothetical protein